MSLENPSLANTEPFANQALSAAEAHHVAPKEQLYVSPEDLSTLTMLMRLARDFGVEHKAAYLMAAVLMAVVAGATAIAAWLLKPVLNGMLSAESFKQLRNLSFFVAGLYMLRGVATYGYLILLSRTGNNIVANVQRRVFAHLLKQDMAFFQDRHSSEFMTRLALAANGVRDSIQVLVTSVGRDLMTVVGLVIVMFVQDPVMALLAMSVLPVAAYFLGQIIRKVRMFARRSFDGSTKIMQVLQESVLGMRIVKSFGLEAVMRQRMEVSISEVERSANRMAAGMAMTSPLAETLGGLAIAFVIFYGSWRVTIAHADPGSFFSFIASLLLAYDPAKRLGRLHVEIQNGLVGARLIYEVLDRPAVEYVDAQPLPPLEVKAGAIEFSDVHFAYPTGKAVINGLNLSLAPGKTSALVGPSGGGKSTILGLLQRFYTPPQGQIVIDGQNIMGCDLASLRHNIAFVSQDVFLFRGTIFDNIALGAKLRGAAPSREAVELAAKRAFAHDFIMAFRDGYNTNVGEQGAQLSGGQRQRIAIARAILKEAPILLLDEPTAALDSESERAVATALDELRQGRTTLVVAHRLQTIIAADCIFVIDGGRAVEQGTHTELMSQQGAYHSFFAAQFGARHG